MAAAYSLLNVPGLEARTDNAFRAELVRRSLLAGYNPDYVAAVISFESGFDANVQNKGGAPALGLIQFWRDFFPPLAAAAGMPHVQWDDLRRMSAIEQLPLVFKYLQQSGPKLKASSPVGDYYLTVFMPAAVGRPADFELGKRGSDETVFGLRKSRVYDQNAGLDADRDGRITVGDVTRKIDGLVAGARQRSRISVDLGGPSVPPAAPSSGAPPMLIAGVGVVFFCPGCSGRFEAVKLEPKP